MPMPALAYSLKPLHPMSSSDQNCSSSKQLAMAPKQKQMRPLSRPVRHMLAMWDSTASAPVPLAVCGMELCPAADCWPRSAAAAASSRLADRGGTALPFLVTYLGLARPGCGLRASLSSSSSSSSGPQELSLKSDCQSSGCDARLA